MPKFDAEALAAAAESARHKSALGSNTTDELAPTGLVADENSQRYGSEDGLSTHYMGLHLHNPVVASAGPLSQTFDGIKRLAEGGVGAIVMYSLFEEQIRHEAARETEMADHASESFAEALSYFPIHPSNESGLVKNYLKLLERGASAVDIPIIASLNGTAKGEWSSTARQMTDAGAAAIELNIYYVPGDLSAKDEDIEKRYVDIVSDVKSKVDVPVAVKLNPYFTNFGEFAQRMDAAGADALVLFNRFLQPDIDLDHLTVSSGFELSTSTEAKLPRTWISTLYGKINASLAATTGVETVDDVVRYILVGADVVMTTASLVRHGPSYASQLVDGISAWLHRRDLTLSQARGMLAAPKSADLTDYARAGYVSGLERTKSTYSR